MSQFPKKRQLWGFAVEIAGKNISAKARPAAIGATDSDEKRLKVAKQPGYTRKIA
jgi:hypothetical protein